MNHIAPQMRSELRADNILHVVACVSNPARYHSRYRLARHCLDALAATPCVVLHLVEATHGERQSELLGTLDRLLSVRTDSEIWIKENLLNLGVRHRLPGNWRYMAWVDADVEFRDSNWAQETLHQLQHFPVLQPWSHCVDLGHLGGILHTFQSFGYLNQQGVQIQITPDEPYPYGHSGFAWACTREWYEQVEGLLDFAILGSADHHMAWAMVGDVDKSIHGGMAPSFFRRCHEWQMRAVRASHGEVGFVPGRIEHHFHGPKRRRQYRERWQMLVKLGFDPDRDLVRDEQGLWRLNGRWDLEAAVRKYNRDRHEDSIEDE